MQIVPTKKNSNIQIHFKFYFSTQVCRFNLNNPEFYCNPSQVGMECYCGPVTDNIVTLIVNVTVMLDYDRADFFFTYGPVQDLDLSDVMHLPERVFGECL